MLWHVGHFAHREKFHIAKLIQGIDATCTIGNIASRYGMRRRADKGDIAPEEMRAGALKLRGGDDREAKRLYDRSRMSQQNGRRAMSI